MKQLRRRAQRPKMSLLARLFVRVVAGLWAASALRHKPLEDTMTTNRIAAALELFKNGYNCSQSICAAFGPEAGLSRELGLAVAAPLGAGLGRSGEVCGAITGALLVLGARHWRDDLEVNEAKERVYGRVQKLLRAFKAAHGTLICRELVGQGLRTPEELAAANEKGVFQRTCAPIVHEVAQLLTACE